MGITQQIGASSIIKPGVIDNTAARPASPYEGQVIFQKDTDQLLVWNGTAWVIPNSPAQNPQGLELISTTTFSGQTQQDISNCFSSTYDNYRIVFSDYTCTTAGEMIMRLQDSGGPISTSNYDSGRTEQTGSVTNSFTFTSTSWTVSYVNGTSTGGGISATMDIYSPNKATYTRFTAQVARVDNVTAAGVYTVTSMGLFRLTTQCTGLSFFRQTTGTLSGTISVYGYRK